MRNEEVERRLLNWARWRLGADSGGLGYASPRLGTMAVASGRYRESVIPTQAAEAVETDDEVARLPEPLRRVAEDHYVAGLSVVGVSLKRECSVATVYGQLARLHLLLDARFHELAEARREERRRVEALQAAHRRASFTE